MPNGLRNIILVGILFVFKRDKTRLMKPYRTIATEKRQICEFTITLGNVSSIVGYVENNAKVVLSITVTFNWQLRSDIATSYCVTFL